MTTTFTHDGAGTSAARWREQPAWSAVLPVDARALRELDRLVVVAAHPDDETLGAGALVALAHDADVAVDVVVASAGEHSHPRSPTYDPPALAALRRTEAEDAVAVLAPGTRPEVVGVPDGQVADHEEDLAAHLVRLVGDGTGTWIVAPWRHDGHPDHEAAGRAAAAAAVRTGARLLEYPVWFWHWAGPDQAPWADLRALAVPAATRRRKVEAVRAHRSQVAPLSDADGDEVLLSPELLAHFTGDREVYVVEPAEDPALDLLHAGDADPWGVDTRWYERRKRDLTLAVLPRDRFAHALEVGCSRGALTEDLARRCDRLVAVDASAHAVEAARRRLGGRDDVTVQQLDVSREWPAGRFDLVVVSEVAYFLSPGALARLIERVRSSLTRDGVVVLCHWRHRVDGWVLDGPETHRRFLDAGLRPSGATYRDRDVELLVLTDPAAWPDPDA